MQGFPMRKINIYKIRTPTLILVQSLDKKFQIPHTSSHLSRRPYSPYRLFLSCPHLLEALWILVPWSLAPVPPFITSSTKSIWTGIQWSKSRQKRTPIPFPTPVWPQNNSWLPIDVHHAAIAIDRPKTSQIVPGEHDTLSDLCLDCAGMSDHARHVCGL